MGGSGWDGGAFVVAPDRLGGCALVRFLVGLGFSGCCVRFLDAVLVVLGFFVAGSGIVGALGMAEVEGSFVSFFLDLTRFLAGRFVFWAP